jgi:N-acetyl-alpha-D-muramate 1-phosphate uridylyltransferase
LQVRGLPLLVLPLQAFARQVVSATVINTGWLGEQIEPAFGSYFSTRGFALWQTTRPLTNPMQLHYSHEGRGAGEALETAGGILRALPLA